MLHRVVVVSINNVESLVRFDQLAPHNAPIALSTVLPTITHINQNVYQVSHLHPLCNLTPPLLAARIVHH